tara:strand:+ start:25 stop:645 length:621 start_codon:yes stop_codon:yes gene_type:complete
MKLDKLSIDGKKDSIEVLDKIFLAKVNNKLVSSVLYKTNANYKGRHAKTKQQNEVRGPTSKIYAQKGTGGARHASRKAPLFVGGGVAHGPKGDNYKNKKINKKTRKIALAQTISKKRNNNELFIFDDVKKEIKKTKTFNSFLVKNNLMNVLIVSDKETEKNIVKSVRNLPNVKLINESGTNVYDLVKYKNVLFTTTSIKNIQDRLK